MDAKVKSKDKDPYDTLELAIERQGAKIILPDDPEFMSLETGRKVLDRAIAAENKEYQINETIHAHFYDGLVALAKALKQKYGWTQAKDGTVDTMFGPMKVKPKFLHVRTGPKPEDFVQVPFGGFQIPNVEGQLETKFAEWKGIPVLSLQGIVKAREKKIVMELVLLTNEIVRSDSIYRGRSVILERDEKKQGLDYSHPLEFFDPVGMEIPIFDKATEDLIRVAVMAPLSNSEACRKAKIPLKRGVLFEGPFGCGKSLVSKQVARVANENEWTFLLVTSAAALKYALTFAKMYQPAVVFVEDIDMSVGDRSETTNDLINMIDGVVTKSDEIMTVMTTNFVERIEKAMLRPGRLDAVISIRPPDAEAVMRLIKFYGGTSLEDNTDLTKAAAKCANEIPATIREVVERSKLGMIAEGRKKVTGDDLVVSATSMENHMHLFRAATASKPVLDPINENIRKTIGRVMEHEFGFNREQDDSED